MSKIATIVVNHCVECPNAVKLNFSVKWISKSQTGIRTSGKCRETGKEVKSMEGKIPDECPLPDKEEK